MSRNDALVEAERQLAEGRLEHALEGFALAAEEAADPELRRLASLRAAQLSLRLGREHEALGWVEELQDEYEGSAEADVLEAAALYATGDAQRALQRLEGVDAAELGDGLLPVSMLHEVRSLASAVVGDHGATLASAAEALRHEAQLPAVWAAVASVASSPEPPDIDIVVATVDEGNLAGVLACLTDVSTIGTDRILEALWERWPGQLRILVTVGIVAHRFPLESCVRWSARLRAAGLAEQCPVLARATRDDVPPAERILAAAVGGAVFDDPRSGGLLARATRELQDGAVPAVLDLLRDAATDTQLADFIAAVATTPRRSLVCVPWLLDNGAPPQALALTRHAAGLEPVDAMAWRAVLDRAFETHHRDQLAQLLRSEGHDALAGVVDG